MSKQELVTQEQVSRNDTDIKRITLVLAFVTTFFIVELWGHFKTGSMSLLGDALHLFVDISGFLISILALKLANRGPDSKMNFGYQRVEVIGALFSVFFIWGAAVYLIMESIHKYYHPKIIDGIMFLRIAIVGLVINLICLTILHFDRAHKEMSHNLNMKATHIHVIGDIIQSIGVLIASAIVYKFPKWAIADLICTIVFAILVLVSTYSVTREAIDILSESAPVQINQDAIKTKILSLDGVMKITDMKIWFISSNSYSISVKVITDHILIKEYESILRSIRSFLCDDLNFNFVNIQIDTPGTNQEKLGLQIGGIKFKEIV